MKSHQFIITGPPRSGKTTFANLLNKKYNLENLCLDPIIDGFQKVFPKLGITHQANTAKTHNLVCQKLELFISSMIKGMSDNFVIEGFRVPLKELRKKHPSLQYFAFGYSKITPQKLLQRCRQFDKNDWTKEMTDKELLKDFRFFIAESQRLQRLCQKLEIPFFDTSQDYHKKLTQALKTTK